MLRDDTELDVIELDWIVDKNVTKMIFYPISSHPTDTINCV
jgi:hypothetical protein